MFTKSQTSLIYNCYTNMINCGFAHFCSAWMIPAKSAVVSCSEEKMASSKKSALYLHWLDGAKIVLGHETVICDRFYEEWN